MLKGESWFLKPVSYLWGFRAIINKGTVQFLQFGGQREKKQQEEEDRRDWLGSLLLCAAGNE